MWVYVFHQRPRIVEIKGTLIWVKDRHCAFVYSPISIYFGAPKRSDIKTARVSFSRDLSSEDGSSAHETHFTNKIPLDVNLVF